MVPPGPDWLRGTVVERWSLAGELSCPALDLYLTGDHMWVNRPL